MLCFSDQRLSLYLYASFNGKRIGGIPEDSNRGLTDHTGDSNRGLIDHTRILTGG